jgi:hypothetical protein
MAIHKIPMIQETTMTGANQRGLILTCWDVCGGV